MTSESAPYAQPQHRRSEVPKKKKKMMMMADSRYLVDLANDGVSGGRGLAEDPEGSEGEEDGKAAVEEEQHAQARGPVRVHHRMHLLRHRERRLRRHSQSTRRHGQRIGAEGGTVIMGKLMVALSQTRSMSRSSLCVLLILLTISV